MAITVTPLDPAYSVTQRFQITGGSVGDTITATIDDTTIASVTPASQSQTSSGVIFTVSGVNPGGTVAHFKDTTSGDFEPWDIEIAGSPTPSPAAITIAVGQTIPLRISEANDPNPFASVSSSNPLTASLATTSNAGGIFDGSVTGVALGSTSITYDDGHGGTGSISVTVSVPFVPSFTPISGPPDVRVSVYDHTMKLLEEDASKDIAYNGISYTDAQFGNDGATIELGELYEQVISEGVWTARNIVEISSGDDTLAQPVSAGDTKLYPSGGRGGYDPLVGHDTGLVYLYDGVNLAMRLPVTLVGNDSGGDFLDLGAAIPYGFAAGTILGRRRYTGLIARREMANVKLPRQMISCVGMYSRLAEFNGSFTFTNWDVGRCIYQIFAQYAASMPEIIINQTNFPFVGQTYSGTRERASIAQQITEVLTGVSNGDQWVVRVGHDRVARLVKLYDSATNSYTFNITIPQNQDYFPVINVKNIDQDARQQYTVIEVIGDTDPITKQPVRAIVFDSIDAGGNTVPGSPLDLYGRIEGSPVTNNALKTVLQCAAFGRGLLNQFSAPRQNSQFTVFTRNPSAGPPLFYTSNQYASNANGIKGSWWDLTGTPSGIKLVQSVSRVAGNSSIVMQATLPSAPTPGNVIVAVLFWNYNNPGAAATGWTKQLECWGNGSAFGNKNSYNIYTHVVQAGDSATYQPVASTSTWDASLYLFEFSGLDTVNPINCFTAVGDQIFSSLTNVFQPTGPAYNQAAGTFKTLPIAPSVIGCLPFYVGALGSAISPPTPPQGTSTLSSPFGDIYTIKYWDNDYVANGNMNQNVVALRTTTTTDTTTQIEADLTVSPATDWNLHLGYNSSCAGLLFLTPKIT